MPKIRRTPTGGWQADFSHRKAGLPRRKKHFRTKEEAQEWIEAQEKRAQIRIVLGLTQPDVSHIADRMVAYSENFKARSGEKPWFEDIWHELSGKEQLAAVWGHFKGRCNYCGEMTKLGVKNNCRKQATIDHIIPVSAGGCHLFKNLVLSCKQCNSKKHDKVPYYDNESQKSTT